MILSIYLWNLYSATSR